MVKYVIYKRDKSQLFYTGNGWGNLSEAKEYTFEAARTVVERIKGSITWSSSRRVIRPIPINQAEEIDKAQNKFYEIF